MDLVVFETTSNRLSWDTLRFTLVNSTMINCSVRFKAILSHSDAFLGTLWVAIPLSTLKRLETTFYITYFWYIASHDSQVLSEIYLHF